MYGPKAVFHEPSVAMVWIVPSANSISSWANSRGLSPY